MTDRRNRRTETIEIGRGQDYAKVATRLKEIHEDSPECSIETSCEWKDGWVIFRAAVTNARGNYTGHSLAKVTEKDKQFEKQETIAVGRALAFAGYLASGEIASFEEMASFNGSSFRMTTLKLTQIKNDWIATRQDDIGSLEQDEKLALFAEWVADITDCMDYLATDVSKWTEEHYTKCLEKIAQEQEPEDAAT